MPWNPTLKARIWMSGMFSNCFPASQSSAKDKENSSRFIFVPETGREASTCYLLLFDSSAYISIFSVRSLGELVICVSHVVSGYAHQQCLLCWAWWALEVAPGRKLHIVASSWHPRKADSPEPASLILVLVTPSGVLTPADCSFLSVSCDWDGERCNLFLFL